MAYMSRFEFVGEILVPKDKGDGRGFVTSGKTKKGDNWKRLMFLVRAGGKSGLFPVSIFGNDGGIIYTSSKDNELMQVKFEDRNDPEVFREVAPYRKFSATIFEGDRREFISSYDLVEYLEENIPIALRENNHQVFVVKGVFKRNFYNGSFRDACEIQHVYLAAAGQKKKLSVSLDLYMNGDSVDLKELETNKQTTVAAYIEEYIDKTHGRMYVPINVVFSKASYDMDNPKHVNLYNYKKSYLEKLTNKKYEHMTWECAFVNNVEEVEFDESMLTTTQKKQIDLGLSTIDDFKPKTQIIGDAKQELRFVKPILTGDFDNGRVDAADTVKEFEEKIFTGNKTSDSLPELGDDKKFKAKKAAAKTKSTAENEELPDLDDEEDLF